MLNSQSRLLLQLCLLWLQLQFLEQLDQSIPEELRLSFFIGRQLVEKLYGGGIDFEQQMWMSLESAPHDLVPLYEALLAFSDMCAQIQGTYNPFYKDPFSL